MGFKIVYGVPLGWWLGLNLLDKHFYFVRPIRYCFAAKKGIKKNLMKKYGNLLISEQVIDVNKKIVYRPPKMTTKEPIKFVPIVSAHNNFHVVIGAWMK